LRSGWPWRELRRYASGVVPAQLRETQIVGVEPIFSVADEPAHRRSLSAARVLNIPTTTATPVRTGRSDDPSRGNRRAHRAGDASSSRVVSSGTTKAKGTQPDLTREVSA
jgi:hypothetical protein